MWKKSGEIETACRFLKDHCPPNNLVSTLKEFSGVDGCPDVIFSKNAEHIGIELTAYSSDERLNRLCTLMLRVSDFVFKYLAAEYADLNGYFIRYSPNEEDVLRERDVKSFAIELLNFARSLYTQHHFRDGNPRRFPKFNARPSARPFENFELLQKYVAAVSIEFHEWNDESPVFISPDGIARHYGTSEQILSETISGKKLKLHKAHVDGLREVWLLIHATGNPRSSLIAPIHESETERLLADSLRLCAKNSGFDKVFVWDGLRGGSIELISGNANLVATA